MQKEPKPTMSFTDLVASKNQKALEPYINQKIEELSANLVNRLVQPLMALGNRLTVHDEVLIEKTGETAESLTERLYLVEDRMLGKSQVEDVAKPLDLVRVSFKLEGGSLDLPLKLHSLSQNINSPFEAEIHAAVDGMRPGESKTLNLDSIKKSCLLTVHRVSRAPETKVSDLKVVPAETPTDVPTTAYPEESSEALSEAPSGNP